MKNNLVKLVSVSLTSLLTISSCSMRSEVNASTEEPKDFMNFQVRNSYSRLEDKDNLKKLIRKECEALFREHENLILNKLSSHLSCEFLNFVIKYILDHPKLGNVPFSCENYVKNYNLDTNGSLTILSCHFYLIECTKKSSKIKEVLQLKQEELIETLQRLENLRRDFKPEKESTTSLIEIYTEKENTLNKSIAMNKSELTLLQKLTNIYTYICEYEKIVSKKEKTF